KLAISSPRNPSNQQPFWPGGNRTMSEQDPTQATPPREVAASTGDTSASNSGMSPLRMVLLAILGLLIVAVIYDRMYARPAAQAAYDSVREMVEANAALPASEQQNTRDDVHALLGREPTK